MRTTRVKFAPGRTEGDRHQAASASSSCSVSPRQQGRHSSRPQGTAGEQIPAHAHARMSDPEVTEETRLLSPVGEIVKRYTPSTVSSSKSRGGSRSNSYAARSRLRGYYSRRSSAAWDVSSFTFTRSGLRTPRLNRSLIVDNAVIDSKGWYDQFTSTDWVQDSIADSYRILALRRRKGLSSRLWLMFDAAQGWILMALIGCLTAGVAYLVDISEAAIFDLKRGYCRDGWYLNQRSCCKEEEACDRWKSWSEVLQLNHVQTTGNCIGFVLGCVAFALVAYFLTFLSKMVAPSHIASTFDEDLGADALRSRSSTDSKPSTAEEPRDRKPATIFYSAAGSGVAEVKVILSGFVLHGYLGLKTLSLKLPALIFSVASGMSLGKEGPFVHIATCIGNIACRMFSKYNLNDGKRREVLSAAAASGVAVAFGSPLGGVLFSLEEVSYYFPPKTLFRTFFCCIAAALSLKFLNPYNTNKIVIFEVRYVNGWRGFELVNFIFLGFLGGLIGALFIKASKFWARTFRRWKPIKSSPLLEVFLVALATGLISFWNRLANLPVTDLLFQLASPCDPQNDTELCPRTRDEIPGIIGWLAVAFFIKAILTVVTFGIKVPAGIYVPSMVCGGLMGRIFGHAVQYAVLSLPGSWMIGRCSSTTNLEHCITPGVYALVAAGATMCGVTRLSVTLAVILFELTGSLDHVLPFAIGILVAKFTADFIEPANIYDVLIDMNSYPFMDNKNVPLFDTDTELGDITRSTRPDQVIDITISPFVRASELRMKLNSLLTAGELDSGLPVVCDTALVGFIPAPDLEFALDRIEGSEDNTLCRLSYSHQFSQPSNHKRWFPVLSEDSDSEQAVMSSPTSLSDMHEEDENTAEADLVPFVDPAPIALETHSSMNLVYQCFSKLGLRYICVLEAGQYRGMVHKKHFVRYMKNCATVTD